MGNTDINYYDIEELGTWPIVSNTEFSEGDIRIYQHRKIERNPKVVKLAKECFKIRHDGRLFCELCGFDFSVKYGEMGDGFIEAHHKQPISQIEPGEKTKIEDLIMVCSNCHSMLHTGEEWLTPEELKLIIND